MKYNELTVGTPNNVDVLVTKVAIATAKNGKPYVRIEARDTEGTTNYIQAWESLVSKAKTLNPGDVYLLKVEVDGNGYYKYHDSKPSETPVDNFLPKINFDFEEYRDKFMKYLESISNKDLIKLITTIIARNTGDFTKFTKAIYKPDCYKGTSELLKKTCDMIEISETVARICELNRDIAIAAAIIYNYEYLHFTDAIGTQINETPIMSVDNMIAVDIARAVDELKNQGITFDPVLVLELQHTATSRFGSNQPATPEAFALRYINEMLDEISRYRNLSVGMEPGTSKLEVGLKGKYIYIS